MLLPMVLANMSWILLSCLMLHSLVRGEDNQNEQPSSSITCPQGSQSYGSYCFAFVLIPQTWMNAELACQRFSSGHLASLLSNAEALFVSSLVKNTVHSYQYIWIGLYDPTHGAVPNGVGWKWSNSDVLTYVDWEKTPSTAAYCGCLPQTSDYLKWREYNCDTELPYICKFKPDSKPAD